MFRQACLLQRGLADPQNYSKGARRSRPPARQADRDGCRSSMICSCIGRCWRRGRELRPMVAGSPDLSTRSEILIRCFPSPSVHACRGSPTIRFAPPPSRESDRSNRRDDRAPARIPETGPKLLNPWRHAFRVTAQDCGMLASSGTRRSRSERSMMPSNWLTPCVSINTHAARPTPSEWLCSLLMLSRGSGIEFAASPTSRHCCRTERPGWVSPGQLAQCCWPARAGKAGSAMPVRIA